MGATTGIEWTDATWNPVRGCSRVSEGCRNCYAERKALDSLRRYKFQMFGYWAGIWVHLNRIAGSKRPNPFRFLVHSAREAQG